ncbi:uncharacterized protein LOC132632470 isoform X1 [Lycium barbarum]|uniref:uncharacterized protein LOC132632470 isoform X1 n=1 Tax=Lycium barbarum TaxID=112863 RepID=UPI00293ED234|nr:uncharacterized protein LOC132632470 isoform X1 [Lycium barbarum]XP_060204397.1 uncharacterized protein LOC132632470 isoform X1 [Lycium barbarum]XP_060204398.1 uncharacterized protein LOC132632470 isoform X1 [Lycium barbarum]XP_060204399.1 uncharacterized protein LOC132632470 isoform X1 [Lycium barbarum]XP_060204400.1 uncharacterized protein LOC132632470 isoform X1 [Lycium barbarum]XP_060204401.1 uncharacterized protein LOC132632470 isoform X1 [Lycium barbarum]
MSSPFYRVLSCITAICQYIFSMERILQQLFMDVECLPCPGDSGWWGLCSHLLNCRVCKNYLHPLHQWAAALEKDMEAEDVADSSTNMDSDSLDADVDDHMRCEKEFELLVEHMITEELALRAIITNSELLVFASTELPMLYWRFKGKYYLWGVFRPKRDSSRNTMMPNGKSAT